MHQYNPLRRARRNVAHHYDLSDQLYDLFLDRDRQYSCAYFRSPEDDLDTAQPNKKRHIAAKLLLRPGQKVLDIGSGWGGLALYLAARMRCRRDRADACRRNSTRWRSGAPRRPGLADRVRFHLRDYREETGQYDRIVSVGMFEHVGVNHYPAFFRKLNELLAPDGVALLHSIGRMDGPGTTNPWMRKYIFPGGYSPALSEVVPVVERPRLWITDIEILRLHYAETLRAWRARFEQNRDRIRALYDERFCRMWEMYLVGSEMAFRRDGHLVFQMQLAKAVDAVPLTRDYMLDWERATQRRRASRPAAPPDLRTLGRSRSECRRADPRRSTGWGSNSAAGSLVAAGAILRRHGKHTTSRVTPLREPDLERAAAAAGQYRGRAGAARRDPDQQRGAMRRVAEFLLPEHFGNAVHGRIFAAIGKLIERGQIANPVTLKNLFDQDGALAEIGGAQYLARLAEAAVTIINAEHYGRTIHDLHLRRELITIGQDVVTEAFQHDLDDPAHRADRARRSRSCSSWPSTGQAEGGFRAFARGADQRDHDGAGRLQARRQDRRGRDRVCRSRQEARRAAPLRPDHPRRPARRWGRRRSPPTSPSTPPRPIAPAHGPDGRIDLTGGRGRRRRRLLLARNVGRAARHPHPRRGIRHVVRPDPPRRGAARGFRQIRRGLQRLAAVPLFIDDTPALWVAALRTRARRLKRQQGLGLIVIDYLQLMRPSAGRLARMENRVQEISEITRGLKAIAKELDVPVLALSQLSRAVEQREDKRPMLADLRESGSIEQDADVVMFIFREEYYLSRGEPTRRPDESDDKFNDRYDRWKERCEATFGMAEVIIAKQRHGPIGTVKLHFEAETTKFDNFIGPEHLPGGYI